MNITGESSPTDGDSDVYTASITGDATNLSYAWSVDASGTINGSSTAAAVNIDWSGTAASTVTCVVTSTDSGVTDSPQTGTLNNVTPSTVSETGPIAVNNYYPLYNTEAGAVAAGNGTTHTHVFNGVTYYMPEGVTFYHGNYNPGGGGGY